jgi:hypothetical protein
MFNSWRLPTQAGQKGNLHAHALEGGTGLQLRQACTEAPTLWREMGFSGDSASSTFSKGRTIEQPSKSICRVSTTSEAQVFQGHNDDLTIFHRGGGRHGRTHEIGKERMFQIQALIALLFLYGELFRSCLHDLTG